MVVWCEERLFFFNRLYSSSVTSLLSNRNLQVSTEIFYVFFISDPFLKYLGGIAHQARYNLRRSPAANQKMYFEWHVAA